MPATNSRGTPEVHTRRTRDFLRLEKRVSGRRAMPSSQLHRPNSRLRCLHAKAHLHSKERRRDSLRRRAQSGPVERLGLNGDVPWHGGNEADYSVYGAETKAWRDAHLRVFPALGNHEFAECEPLECLRNWWRAFPELKDRRWYSV